MELSPEERQRKYAEERLEAQQQVAEKQTQMVGKRTLGCLVIFVGLIVILAIIGAFSKGS